MCDSLNKEMVENFFKYQDDLIEGYQELVCELGELEVESICPRLKIAMDEIMRCAEE